MTSKVETVYASSPSLAQDIMVSAQGMLFRTLRTSDRILGSELRRLLVSEAIDGERRRAELAARLRWTIRHAASTTPYYQEQAEKGHLPSVWSAKDVFAALASLPLLDKATVRERTSAFHSSVNTGEPRVRLFTSGTTGSPLETLETRSSMSRRFAFVARLRTWAGVRRPLHPRRVQFTGRRICQEEAPFWRRNWVDHSLLLSTVHISRANAEAYASAMRRWDPDLMDGYPSAMLALARLCRSEGIPTPQVPVIISTAETLTEDMRRELEESYGSRVFNQYASTEPSCFWSTCEAGRMHVHEEYGLSEILRASGEPARPGEIGEIVVTGVLNPVMPLIRYRTGDLARVAQDASCPCGRDLPLVEEVTGRQDDVLYVPERGFVGRLDPVFKGLSGIIEAQIVQEQLDRVIIKVVEDSSGFSAASEKSLLEAAHSKLGQSTSVEVVRVDEIPRGPNGKFRAVISQIS